MNNEYKKERLLELLADQAIFGLNKEELNEFENFKNEFPEFAADNSFEFTASAIGLSKIKAFEPLPESLHTRMLAEADEYFPIEIEVEGKPQENNLISEDAAIQPLQGTINDVASVEEPRFSFMQWLGWGVAFAACLALIANIWFTRIQPDKQVVEKKPTVIEKEPTVAEQKQQFLALANDVVTRNWSSPKEGETLSGEIVWSNAEQKGFTTFRGLPVNDSSKESYQLWIFDETQGETPINGGVFNVDKNGEVTIPIDAGIKVKKPKQFAVTVEKSGGVVVPNKEKIVAVAKV
ncbi:MAG: anti-sigma factor domain-containing protein [Aridibacter sp.]